MAYYEKKKIPLCQLENRRHSGLFNSSSVEPVILPFVSMFYPLDGQVIWKRLKVAIELING